MCPDTKNEELEKMLGKLLPYQIQAFYLLKDIEKKKRGGIFDPLLFGGKDVLIFLIMMVNNFHLSARDGNINVPKKMRPTPENTIIFSESVDSWRLDFERHGKHLRILYHEVGSNSKINFHTTDIVVVSSCLNLKQLEDPCSKSIKLHDWHRLVVEEDMLNKDTIDFILKMKVKKRWVVCNSTVSTSKANFVHALLTGSASVKNYPLAVVEDRLKHVTPTIEKLYPFGSKLVQTIPIELTDEEKEIYLVSEIWVKQQLKDIKLLDQRPEEEKVKKDRFRELELFILRLREMVSSIPLVVEKRDIRGNSELMEKVNEQEKPECPICFCELNIIFGTSCKHLFCLMCIEECLKAKKCALCRNELDDNDLFSTPVNCVSTKANILLDRIKSKSLIVSKFDMMLSWLESILKEKEFKVHRIYEKMEAEELLKIAQLFSSDENMVLLASFEAISDDMDITSIRQVFFMEAVKENEENAILNHITGVKGNRNDTFQGAFRLIVKSAIEAKMVGLKGEVQAGFKELNMKEIDHILT